MNNSFTKVDKERHIFSLSYLLSDSFYIWGFEQTETKYSDITRSSHPVLFYKKGVLKDFAKFKGKRLC